MILNNQRVTEEIKEEIKKKNPEDNENTTIQNLWDTENSSKKEFYSNTSLPQDTRKMSIKQPTCTPKGTKTRTNPKLVEGKK